MVAFSGWTAGRAFRGPRRQEQRIGQKKLILFDFRQRLAGAAFNPSMSRAGRAFLTPRGLWIFCKNAHRNPTDRKKHHPKAPVNPRKLTIALLLLAGIAAFIVMDLGRYFSLAALKESQGAIATLYAQRPLLVALVYFAVYVAITALSLPGADIMTQSGGAIFGVAWGTGSVCLRSVEDRDELQ